MRYLSTCIIACLLFVSSNDVHAWGWDGHKLICAMAERQLTPDAKAMVDRYLEEGAELKGGRKNFAESCLWADDVKYSVRKDTYEHHFINVPEDAMTIDLTRDCEATNCIAIGVQRALVYLTRETDGDRAIERRAGALRYLGHYIADLHQPLHIGNSKDWGGNKIKVSWFKKKDANLHAIWDYEMLETMNITYPESIDFLMTVPAESDEKSILAWMNESLALGRSHGYVDHKGDLIESGDRLGKAYLERNKPIILERVALAARRLADLLNAIAAGEKPVAFRLTAAD